VAQATGVGFSQYVDLALSYARFVQSDEGVWLVEIPVLPGCVTWGKTRAEAVLMARDAVEAWVLTGISFGDPLPEIDGSVLLHGAGPNGNDKAES